MKGAFPNDVAKRNTAVKQGWLESALDL